VALDNQLPDHCAFVSLATNPHSAISYNTSVCDRHDSVGGTTSKNEDVNISTLTATASYSADHYDVATKKKFHIPLNPLTPN